MYKKIAVIGVVLSLMLSTQRSTDDRAGGTGRVSV